MPPTAIYCASKAAGWSFTNSLRQQLLPQHTQVVDLHVGYMGTDMTAGVDAPCPTPPISPRRPSTASRPAPTKSSPTASAATSAPRFSGDLVDLYPLLGR